MPDIICVRLKPFDPDRGHVKDTWRAPRPWGQTFTQGIWEEFDLDNPDHAIGVEYLRSVLMEETDPNSPPAFNICTRAQAKEIRRVERMGQLEPVARPRPPKPQIPSGAASRRSVELNQPPPTHELDEPPEPPADVRTKKPKPPKGGRRR